MKGGGVPKAPKQGNLQRPNNPAMQFERLLAMPPEQRERVIEKLPPQLQDLIARSMALQARVRRLDATIHAAPAERATIGNPLVPQLNRLKAAFEQ